MGPIARLRDWLNRPPADARPPAPDDLVAVRVFATRQDADLALWQLDVNGVKAMVQHNDANGIAPHYGLADGHRVLVLARDLEHADTVLSRDD